MGKDHTVTDAPGALPDVADRRLLLVHAHPDDETLTTGGTIARYVAEGAEVTVVTCTLGEEGEVIGDEWAQLTADRADQLGGYRILELTRALDALGVERPRFLGGAGHWRDSGMAGTPSADNPRAWVNADRDEAIEALVAVIRETRPHVVVTYDPFGGYGHPDHIAVHERVTAAVEAAGTEDYPSAGAAWTPAKVYWTVAERSALERGIAAMGTLPDGWRRPKAGELPSVPDDEVTTVVDVRSVLDAKRTAMAAHTTQVLVAEDGEQFVLSNLVAQPVFDQEHFVLVRGQLGLTDSTGREDDLFSGIG
ncbi:N-acetyl-1-D-myo-inositol-2-amino-2-deoxy-alpha-D-glucopyranoside deacetylase [Rhodococcus pyridinivorans]|uniref:1D-myo-inositol 2-acetamido-2-deoxy-alpha-D-glucopyranoside deacetylase n=1 Tax=Rhodococcus pyridinivorans TaxID=103816 RepID=A0A7M2XQ45_9NOCA|nr:N-acetyl-1-D-myo-inositol-2-amino-2-deoxy-alpha-D-glucopyranoside deacetylase [Rhodococcus pyridinivorans]QOV99996.1 N-acetyl-1-D-myo-inositol-2-amino-2-deoxy-alpha-D-glucopyranoside deacetylase [Rhodococcus pyridinivorans]WMM73886.1 N-acetyl-1-D-myo-inositol-2-amino-2-deoxy-alpha-D-glucopyranoside deacetylase [Rhodococcus pyridinivorans]